MHEHPLPDNDDEGTDLEEFLAADPMMAACMEEIARKQHLLQALAAQQVANAVGRMVRTENCRSSDGMGAPVRMMPAFAYHDLAHQMGGYECFQDKSFNRYLDRVAPETRVKPTGTKLQVGWTAGTPENIEIFGSGKAPRFFKAYGEGRKPGGDRRDACPTVERGDRRDACPTVERGDRRDACPTVERGDRRDACPTVERGDRRDACPTVEGGTP